ncbi:MAG: tRNA (guanosine(37)-N1)-methyltransferase TrmD [Erysipelotrichales bacterium]|nr:tRNA (guanosine(37)-N1)-methyltransferase TrmD [Erysipelotrichales bacterium]
MKISILTLFPSMFDGFLSESIIKRAIEKKLVKFEIIDIRDFSKLNNNQVDDTPYGGGAGMVMMVEPVVDAINSVKTETSKVYLMTPAGIPFKESIAQDLSKEKHIILVCGHYEGIDERILNYVDGEVSIGDYVLTGGELPAMVISDAVTRLIDGVIKKESYEEESFNDNLLDYPTYTKPYEYDGHKVPDVLLSGHHKNIAEWRKSEQIKKTQERRPDLMK